MFEVVICRFLECSNFTELNFCYFENNRFEYKLCAKFFVLMNLAGRILRRLTDGLGCAGFYRLMSRVRTGLFFEF